MVRRRARARSPGSLREPSPPPAARWRSPIRAARSPAPSALPGCATRTKTSASLRRTSRSSRSLIAALARRLELKTLAARELEIVIKPTPSSTPDTFALPLSVGVDRATVGRVVVRSDPDELVFDSVTLAYEGSPTRHALRELKAKLPARRARRDARVRRRTAVPGERHGVARARGREAPRRPPGDALGQPRAAGGRARRQGRRRGCGWHPPRRVVCRALACRRERPARRPRSRASRPVVAAHRARGRGERREPQRRRDRRDGRGEERRRRHVHRRAAAGRRPRVAVRVAKRGAQPHGARCRLRRRRQRARYGSRGARTRDARSRGASGSISGRSTGGCARRASTAGSRPR